jgi:hypothetical protein
MTIGNKSKANNSLLSGNGVQLKKNERLITPPILGYSDFSKPFELHTYACSTGLELYYSRSKMGITE